MNRKIAVLLSLMASVSAGSLVAYAQTYPTPSQSGVAATPQDTQRATACVGAHGRALAVTDQIARRLEAARASSSPADLRTAIDDLQSALNQVRVIVQGCVAPEQPAGGVSTAKPAGAVDHAAMGHAMPPPTSPQVDSQLVTVCAQSQREVVAVTERLNGRLEAARQTNAVAAMRAAVDEMAATLGSMRASLSKCEPLRVALAAAAAAVDHSAMDHSKMAMGAGVPAVGSGAKPTAAAAHVDHAKMPMGAAPVRGADAKTPPPVAPMDHSKMPMGRTPAGGRGTAAGTKPAPSTPMDHSKMQTGEEHAAMKMDTPKLPVLPAERIPDPACPDNITQATAPKAVYGRKVYFFCTVKERDLFRKDPPAYLKAHPRKEE